LLRKYKERTAVIGANNTVNNRGFNGDNKDNSAVNSTVDKILYFLVKDNKRDSDITEK
jgi:hypothetical protein